MRSRVNVLSPAGCLLLGTLLSVLVNSCKSESSPAESTDRAARPVLVFGTIFEPDTLDPIFTEIAGAQEIVRLLFRDLTVYDEQWRTIPQMAAEVPVIQHGDVGATVRWRLRPGLRWSDGRPVTADDLLFGYEIERNPDLPTASALFLGDVAGVDRLDGRQVQVRWNRRGAALISPRVHAILPKHAYPDPEKTAKPFRGFRRRPVSNGPYRLSEWKPGEHLSLEPNPFFPLRLWPLGK